MPTPPADPIAWAASDIFPSGIKVMEAWSSKISGGNAFTAIIVIAATSMAPCTAMPSVRAPCLATIFIPDASPECVAGTSCKATLVISELTRPIAQPQSNIGMPSSGRLSKRRTYNSQAMPQDSAIIPIACNLAGECSAANRAPSGGSSNKGSVIGAMTMAISANECFPNARK